MGRFLRRLRRSSRSHPAASAGVVLALAALEGSALGLGSCAPAAVATVEEGVVVRAVDGDTLVVRIEGREEKVRLLGVDTPESVHPRRPVERFGKEAAAFTRRLAEGKTVRLRDDPSNTNRDRYGRMLRYVFLPDGALLNAAIIAEGYGHAYTRYPFERMEEFRALERRAREEERGLWGALEAELTASQASASVEPAAPGAGEPKAPSDLTEGEVIRSGPPGVSGEERGPTAPVTGEEEPGPARSVHEGKPDEIVYVTRSGTRYHLETCKHLARSAIPVKLKDAAERYLPCVLCRPPVRTASR